MTTKQPIYLSFLIRLWREEGTQKWRAMAINPHTGERKGFADLRDLLDFLEQQTQTIASGEEVHIGKREDNALRK